MNLIKDIYSFFNILSFVDIIFFVAIITLLILLVTLVYFIRINKDVLNEDDFFPPSNPEPKVEEIKIENNIVEPKEITSTLEEDILEEYNDEEGELLDLESLTKKLKSEEGNERVNCTEYEKEQEEKAIISYEELLKKKNKYAINYETEEVMDDLIVKKVNLNDLVNKNEEEKIESDIRVISYQKEEAFLDALKELNSLLN